MDEVMEGRSLELNKSETAVLAILKAPTLQRDSQHLDYIMYANTSTKRFAKSVNYRVKRQIYKLSRG